MILLSLSFAFAQSEIWNTGSTDVATPTPANTQPANAQEKPADYDYINDISFRFCNKWIASELLTEKDLVAINAGETKELCLVFFNQGDKPQKIYYGYSSAEISPNNGLPMCGGDLGVGDFASMISISGSSVMTIDPGEHIVKYDKLFLPPGIGSGIHHWCINYGQKKDEPKDTGMMFSVQSRKAAWLDILVNGVASLKNAVSINDQQGGMFVTNKKIKASIDANGNVVIGLMVKNEGNVDQLISMSWVVSNFLGYQEKFALDPQTLWAYQSMELTHVLESIPGYKWFFEVKLDMHHNPSYNVDVSSLPKELLQWWDVSETGKLFVFSWIFVGVVVVALLVIILIIKSLFRKKQPVGTV